MIRRWLSRRKVMFYEADNIGRVYSCHKDGSVWPTGVTLPNLASLNRISEEMFRAEIARARGRRGIK